MAGTSSWGLQGSAPPRSRRVRRASTLLSVENELRLCECPLATGRSCFGWPASSGINGKHPSTLERRGAGASSWGASGLAEHAAHAGAGHAVDDGDADGGDDDQDHAEGGRLVGAARDVEGEDADGDRLPAAQGQEEHGGGLLQRGHEREERADQHARQISGSVMSRKVRRPGGARRWPPPPPVERCTSSSEANDAAHRVGQPADARAPAADDPDAGQPDVEARATVTWNARM